MFNETERKLKENWGREDKTFQKICSFWRNVDSVLLLEFFVYRIDKLLNELANQHPQQDRMGEVIFVLEQTIFIFRINIEWKSVFFLIIPHHLN